MSTPDSVPSVVALSPAPRLTIVPRPQSALRRFSEAINGLPPIVVAAAGLMAIQTAAFLAGRLLAVNLMYDVFIDSTETARVLGGISFFSIVPIAAAILLGRRALASVAEGRRPARQVTIVVLGIAYLHLLLWTTRVLTAAIAVQAQGSLTTFLPNVFWWG